ncbi:hypothetical protein K0M31_020331, partial [Melipona bicolor]
MASKKDNWKTVITCLKFPGGGFLLRNFTRRRRNCEAYCLHRWENWSRKAATMQEERGKARTSARTSSTNFQGN